MQQPISRFKKILSLKAMQTGDSLNTFLREDVKAIIGASATSQGLTTF